LIHEAEPARRSRVTVVHGSVNTSLSVVAGIDGAGVSYVRTLVGATSVGKNAYCVQSLDETGRPRNTPVPGENSRIGDREWARNMEELCKTIRRPGGMAPSAESESRENKPGATSTRNARGRMGM
jgi:hypothetical protein